MVVESARVEDAAAIFDLLARNRLPLDGLADLANAVVVREGDRVAGVAALELYDHAALLRSVAVDAALQGRGVGHQLTEAALQLARDRGVTSVYLLTTTAAGFFPRFGFTEIARDDVPAAVRASVEFTSACPSTAIVMMRRLDDD